MEEILSLIRALSRMNKTYSFGQLLSLAVPQLYVKTDTQIIKALADACSALPMTRMVILPIGLPGSGKSSYAAGVSRLAGQNCAVCSTDSFFMKDGEYRFDPKKLSENHARNFQAFAMALARGVRIVIVDNTNLRAEHRQPYIDLATAMGYPVDFVVIGEFTDEACQTYAQRNTHGVPLDSIKRMAATVQLPE